MHDLYSTDTLKKTPSKRGHIKHLQYSLNISGWNI